MMGEVRHRKDSISGIVHAIVGVRWFSDKTLGALQGFIAGVGNTRIFTLQSALTTR